MLRSIGINSLGICGVGPEEEKRRLRREWFAEREVLRFSMLSWFSMTTVVSNRHTQTDRQTDGRTDKPRNVGKNTLHRILA